MPNEKKIYLSPPFMYGSERTYMLEAFDSNWIAPLGPFVDRFEADFAKFVGASSAAALSSGTAGIHLALQMLGVGHQDEVFVSDLTFIASANPVSYLGAIPVFIDSEMSTWNMCPDTLRNALRAKANKNKLPKAVIVAHIMGQPAAIEEIEAICREFDVPLIEDAAESLGGYVNGRHSGTFGQFGIFSFNGNKIMTTSGGGMLIANDADVVRTRKLASQARENQLYYEHNETGFNYRLSNLLAAVGVGQLENMKTTLKKRRHNFSMYSNIFSERKFQFQGEPSWSQSSKWIVCGCFEDKNIDPVKVVAEMAKQNIECRPLWKPLHLQPVFKGAEFIGPGNSVKLFKSGIALPSGTGMTDDELVRVCDLLAKSASRMGSF